jgi:hypothetical protein
MTAVQSGDRTMTRIALFAGVAALTLLAGCGEQEAAPVNLVTVNASEDANVVVPAANAAEPAPVANETAAAAPALTLAPDGLSVVGASGSARQVGFGMAQGVAVPIVTAALGKPSNTGRNEECGQGPMDTVAFTGGITLFFMEGKFVGWDLDGKSAFATASGIGMGSTLKQLREAMHISVDESTLGHEFAAGDLGGLLSDMTPAGKVTALWAGSTCQFR